jgi:hypothetical protein
MRGRAGGNPKASTRNQVPPRVRTLARVQNRAVAIGGEGFTIDQSIL